MSARPLLTWLALQSAVLAVDTRLVRETNALSPAQEQTRLHVPAGFEVQLFASEPMINKPINMAFDARGRLWVSSTVEYPYAAEKSRWADPQCSHVKDSRDAIKILEDTDGDGRADQVTSFATGLNIPTGVLPWHKPEHHVGCIAWSIPNIWYFADTDGDGKADLREILFGPLGYEKDTHGMCSSFRLGLDGWIYATHGFSNTSTFRVLPQHRQRTPENSEPRTLELHSGNVFRFRPDGSAVELWSAGQVNPFGLAWDRYNNLYSADCHSSPVYQLIRGAHYPSFGKPHDGLGFAPVMCQHTHGSTGICGIVYIDGGIWGPEWDDHLFLGNVVTSKINHDRVTFAGSTPKANEQPDFLTSDDPWFRPVDLQLGPDHALYIADFYNKIIGHYEVPLDHPGRDKERGRIWRVMKKDSKPLPRDFTSMNSQQIAGELGSPNLLRRHFALREVKSRGTKAWLPDLFTIFDSPESGAPIEPAGDKTPAGMQSWDVSPSDFNNDGFGFKEADLRTAYSLWALSYLGERFAVSAVMRDLHTGGWWVEDARDERGLVVPERQMGLVMSHAAQILGSYDQLHPWENWNLGIVFDCRGSAAGRAVCQTLLNRSDFIDDDPSWQVFTTINLIEVLRRLLDPKPDDDGLSPRHKPDPQYALAMKLLLRDWFSRPKVFTNVMSNERVMRLQKDSINAEWFEEVLYAVPSADVSRWLCSNHVYDKPEALRQIATHGDTQTVRSIIPRAWGAAKVNGLSAMYEGFLERGGPLPSEFLQTCVAAAESLLGEKTAATEASWRATSLSNLPSSDSPWCIQERECADGQKTQVISSLDKDKKSPEKLTGILHSKTFTAPAKLSFWLCGHQGIPKGEANHKNLVRLMLNDKAVREAFPPRNDVCQRVEWDLADVKGQQVHLEVVDGDDGPSYAWIGIARMVPEMVRLESFTSDNEKQKQLRTLAMILKTTATVGLRDKLAPYLPKPAASAAPPKPRPELDALIAARSAAFAKAKPNLEIGSNVFKMNCAACHQIKGEGGLIGPQLDGIGTRGPARIIEDILDPNRNVDAHFHLHLITRKDGTTLSGFLKAEVGQVLILADAAGTETRIPKSDIKADTLLPQSLMPPTFGQTLPESDFSHLLAWLLSQ